MIGDTWSQIGWRRLGVILVCGFAGVSCADEPSATAQKQTAQAQGKQAAKPSPKPSADSRQSIEYWIEQLDDDRYLRREAATEELIDAGPAVVEPLSEVLKSGDLEVTERAISVLQRIALTQPPAEDGGAWGKLRDLADSGAGSGAARAIVSVQEIREARGEQASRKLADAGVFIGMSEFVVQNASKLRPVVQLGDQWNGDTEPLQWLRWISHIKYARVEGKALRGDVLTEVARMPDVHTLALMDGSVAVDALATLEAMPHIHTLELRYVPLTESHAQVLARLPVRVSLSLMGTGLDREIVRRMREELPGLQIEFKQGGFLGVLCIDGFNACRISSVVEGSAAHDAGLIPGDIIIGLDEAKVDTFRDLQDAINQHMPGDSITIRYLRGGEVQSATVELGRLRS